ncbi:MAG: hypothetical protein ACP5N1_00270 [Candidatus Woesearchaeota archaeon]
MVGRNITTGVDRLVEIISEKKRVELDVAAKLLGVGKDVVQEWAQFLEEEGIVTIDYNLSKVWISERKINKEDVLTNVKEVSSEKEAFTRKIDVAISSLKEETSDFETIRSEFLNIQGNIKDEIDILKKQLVELDRYDSLRKNLGKDLDSQRMEYDSFAKDVQDKLKIEMQKYEQLRNIIAKEKENIDQYAKKIDELIKLRTDYERTILSLKESLKNIDRVVVDYKKRFEEANKVVKNYKASLDILDREVSDQKNNSITKKIEVLKANEDRLFRNQLIIEKQIREKTANIESHSGLSDKVHKSFEGFFSKNIATEKLISEIENDKLSLTKDLEELKSKVIAFTLLTSNAIIKSELKDIEDKIRQFEVRKQSIKSKIEQLVSLFKK